jgi:glycine cleavage system H protein
MKAPKNGLSVISRRDFLKGTGLVIGGAMLATPSLALSCKSTAESSESAEPFYTVTNITGSSLVAMDRLYSIEHIWVKTIAKNTVQIGITDKLQKVVGNAGATLLPVGTIIHAGDIFGSLEAWKINMDLISPVSGEITESNQELATAAAGFRINMDPYGLGWMLEIKLSNPKELDNLVSPMYYAYLQTQKWEGDIPAMH